LSGVGYLVLGLASGLEAFSREPPCDSVGALAARQTPETSGTAWEFLSYYPILPSRYLRDPPINPEGLWKKSFFVLKQVFSTTNAKQSAIFRDPKTVPIELYAHILFLAIPS
jgi:hypothetical protein